VLQSHGAYAIDTCQLGAKSARTLVSQHCKVSFINCGLPKITKGPSARPMFTGHSLYELKDTRPEREGVAISVTSPSTLPTLERQETYDSPHGEHLIMFRSRADAPNNDHCFISSLSLALSHYCRYPVDLGRKPTDHTRPMPPDKENEPKFEKETTKKEKNTAKFPW
jgi:hypothetical protein